MESLRQLEGVMRGIAEIAREDGRPYPSVHRATIELWANELSDSLVEMKQERDELQAYTVSALAKNLGQGEMSIGDAWTWLVSREYLLRKVQKALETHKSNAPTAEAALEDRLSQLGVKLE